MIITDNLNNEQLINRIYAAAAQYELLLNKTFLIVGQNKKEPFYWFECVFEKKNFMHLLGIKSKTYSADEFLDACIAFNHGTGNGITVSDCTPAYNHSRKTVNKKSSCLAEMLNIKDAKYMKVGDKDLINLHVNFKYAYGNEATLGFFEEDNTFPITLLPNNIDNYASNRHKVIFVFEKTDTAIKYAKPDVEIAKGLFEKIYDDFPVELQNLIENPKIEQIKE